ANVGASIFAILQIFFVNFPIFVFYAKCEDEPKRNAAHLFERGSTMKQYAFDTAHSNIGFWVRHLVVSKVHGGFTRWNGTLQFDPAQPEKTRVDVTIEAAS